MKAFAEKTNSKLTIAHYRRALPKFLYIKELIGTGAIGEIRTVRISMLQKDKSTMIAGSENNWRVDPAIAGAGLFYDLAPHQLDLVVYFFGKPFDVTGISANQAGLYKAEDVVTGIMRLPNNIVFSGQWCYTVGEGLDEDLFEIVGSKGKISFTVFGHEVVVHDGCTEKMVNFEPPAHIQQPLITEIVRYFLGEGGNPCSADEAIESMKVMEAFAYGQQK
jgi:predicted dehydrogenase